MGARDDAEALRDLLHAATVATIPNPTRERHVESICSLWDANQHVFERLAAEVDPAFYRAWEARSATARAWTAHGAGRRLSALTSTAPAAGSSSAAASSSR